ncbi:hypothetical protein HHK36_029771 [Tetracentron sinense]|uniref:Uncharacterized protein n=1 Tax=Tetracentron sinense TaxID=13715 RepID=A0A835CZX5_TETSI|nr:hypothetical protein HHK36_029771 [Tetracentron sinense]
MLQLSIGLLTTVNELNYSNSNKYSGRSSPRDKNDTEELSLAATRLKERSCEQLRLAMAEKAFAEEARHQAKQLNELAEQEFANAKRIRQQAQAKLNKAHILKRACHKANQLHYSPNHLHFKQQFKATTVAAAPDENSLLLSHERTITKLIKQKSPNHRSLFHSIALFQSSLESNLGF